MWFVIFIGIICFVRVILDKSEYNVSRCVIELSFIMHYRKKN
jgi:hypothetical protein